MNGPITTIVLIEDDEDDYIITRDLLDEVKQGRFELQWVSTYEEALALLRAPRADVYLVDYRLGVHNGLDLLREALSQGVRAPIILLTGQGNREVDVEAMQAGAADYLVKGHIDSFLLERAIRYAIERKQAEEEVRRHAARAEALARIAARLNAVLDLDTVLNTVCEETAHALNAPAAMVGLYDERYDHILFTATFGLPPGDGRRFYPIPRALYEEYAQAWGKLVTIPDAQALPELPNAPLYAQYNIRTICTAAMFRTGQLIGVLNVLTFETVRAFSADELALLQGLADQAAQAIVNARLFANNLEQLVTLNALYSTAQKFAENLDPTWLAQDITRTCVEAFEARVAWLGRAEPDGLIRPMAYFPAGEIQRQVITRWNDTLEGQGPSGRAIRGGYPVVVEDIFGDPAFAPWREAVRAPGVVCAASFPLVSRSRPLGVLVLLSDRPGFFTLERVDFFKAYTRQAAVALENARLLEDAERRFKHVEALRNIDVAITSNLDLRLTLDVILEQVTAELHVDAAGLLIFKEHNYSLEFAAGRGFRTGALQHTRLRPGEGHAGQAALERRVVYIPDLTQSGAGFKRSKLLTGEDFVAYYAVPLIAKGQIKGVLEIFHRSPLDPNREWLEFLETLGGQAAIAIDNAALFNDLQRSNADLILAYDATIEGWSHALDLRDKETEGHTLRVTDMSVRLAQAMGMADEELVQVRRGGLLHDIGKMGIPDSILLKPGPLSDDEWVIMRKHPTYAYEMLSPIAYLQRALDIPYYHHEKWDGTGYPRGLVGEQIPLAARIFAVADVWDALRSDRPYRPAWPEEKVREHTRAGAGSHFDRQVVEVFLRVMGQT